MLCSDTAPVGRTTRIRLVLIIIYLCIAVFRTWFHKGTISKGNEELTSEQTALLLYWFRSTLVLLLLIHVRSWVVLAIQWSMPRDWIWFVFWFCLFRVSLHVDASVFGRGGVMSVLECWPATLTWCLCRCILIGVGKHWGLCMIDWRLRMALYLTEIGAKIECPPLTPKSHLPTAATSFK